MITRSHKSRRHPFLSLSLDLRETLVFVEINKRERERERRVFAVLVVAKNDVRSFFSATAVVPRPIMAGGGRIERSRGARNGRLAE